MDRFNLDRLNVISNSWVAKACATILATGILSVGALPSQQNPPQNQQPETPSGREPRTSSFPGVKTKVAPVVSGQTAASKVAVEKEPEQAPEALLYETRMEVGLRNIPNVEVDPVVEARLPKGTLLWMLAKEDGTGFSRVSVLGGFRGYVFAKYCRPDGEGNVEVIGDRLAFRAKPSTKGWPIDKLRRGTRLPLLSREGDWYLVLSNPEVGALVPDSTIQKLAAIRVKPGGELASFAAGSDHLKRAEKQYEVRQASWRAVREKSIASAKRQRSIAGVQQEISDLRARIRQEKERDDPAKMDLDSITPLLDLVREHAKAIEPADPVLVGSLATVAAEFKWLHTILAGYRAMQVAPKTPQPVAARPASAKKRGFDQSGWVRYRPGGYSSFQLVKGGEVMCFLVCSSLRYNLKDYVGCELGVKGKVGPRSGADFKVLDVERIRVLASR